MINFTVLRTIFENIGYSPEDIALHQVTEQEARQHGFKSRKELIKHEINTFLNNREEVKSFINDLKHDVNLSFIDFPELCKSYRKTIQYLEKLIND